MTMLAAGQIAPDFTVKAHDGSTVKLSDHAGKYVLLWFYPAADTPGWTIEGNGFRDRIRDLEAKNLVVLGASFDDVEANRKFAEKFSYPYKLLSFSKEQGRAYGSLDDKESGYAKRISYLIGPDGKIVKAYDKVKPANHPTEVLADIPAS